MNDYSALIAALRCCAKMDEGCDGCFKCGTFEEQTCECEMELKKQAADALESLQNDLNSAAQTIADLSIKLAISD